MGFLSKLLQGISYVPTIVHGVEGLLGGKSGDNKKAVALSFVDSAVGTAEAIASKHVVDAGKFNDGLGKVIDGVVACLNASVWAHK